MLVASTTRLTAVIERRCKRADQLERERIVRAVESLSGVDGLGVADFARAIDNGSITVRWETGQAFLAGQSITLVELLRAGDVFALVSIDHAGRLRNYVHDVPPARTGGAA